MMLTTKRGREDGHLSREEYDEQQSQFNPQSSMISKGFPLASKSIIQSRKIVTTRQQEYARHICALNHNFSSSIKAYHANESSSSWVKMMKEYLAYELQIEERFGAQEGKVLTFGSGDCGQLAHGVEHDRDMIVKFPREVAALQSKQIVRLSCGGLHSAAVTNLGQVYTWGCNDDGALGRSGEENIPLLVDGFPTGTCINLVVAGDCHSAALSVSGDVYTWGSYKDKDGKPWCDARDAASCFKHKNASPYHVSTLHNIVDVKCGDAFNLAKRSDGQVFSWGLGEMGQLARPVCRETKDSKSGQYYVEEVHRTHLTPALLELNDKPIALNAKAIGCGSYHTLVSLGESGDLYTSGLNNYGQLGIGSTDNSWALSLVETLVDENIVLADGGSHHSVVLTTSGSMFAFGRGDSGQLGTVDEAKTGFYNDVPQRISIPNNGTSGQEKEVCVTMISVGANHALALSSANDIYSWGYGDMLQLGNGREGDANRPKMLDWNKTSFGKAKVLQVEAGGQHSAVLAMSSKGKSMFSS